MQRQRFTHIKRKVKGKKTRNSERIKCVKAKETNSNNSKPDDIHIENGLMLIYLSILD